MVQILSLVLVQCKRKEKQARRGASKTATEAYIRYADEPPTDATKYCTAYRHADARSIASPV